MAHHAKKIKLNSFSKEERLCNFTLKKLLFEQGNQFQEYPFKIFWKIIDQNLEKVFFAGSPFFYSGDDELQNPMQKLQNPSYPKRKIPGNAYFHQPVKCLTGVSAKQHKSAVKRNRIKRLVKEAYRNNKHELYTFLNEQNCFCILGIIYTANPILSYPDIEAKIIVSLQKLVQKISQQPESCD
ncbi:MAG: ribonuclease P protein component [Bacteroidales bacterium]